MKKFLLGLAVVLVLAVPAFAQETSFSLTTVEGPVSMRAADTQAVGTFDLNILMDYSTSSNGSDDDFVTEFKLEWGVTENHQIDFTLPFNYGDGTDDNGDLAVAWQWKLLEEDGMLPAFAVYNQLRFPTGYHSSGVDWELRAIFTKTLNDRMRLHANPFIEFVGGDDAGRRDFHGGVVLGTDYALTSTTTMNFDYIIDSGLSEGYGTQHIMEAGLTYALDENQSLAWATRWTMDGDGDGDNWGIGFQYIISGDLSKLW